MAPSPPPTLERLLAASAKDPEFVDHAWSSFLEEYSDLLLRVARRLGGDEDEAMDRYTFILGELRAECFRRLRGYVSDGRGKFSTWLVVVARRLCYDHHRRRYGRRQGAGDASAERQAARRSLVELVGVEVDVCSLEDPSMASPDEAVRVRELRAALGSALGALPTRDRLILRLRFEEELSVPEIARALGDASPFAMYRRIDKLLKRLRDCLHSAGVDDPRA